MLKKILFTTLFLLTIVLSSVYYLFHRSKPVSEGVVFLKGLESKVRIVKDEWGVPHITSESERDAYFALGFVMASERLFQMDIQRRLANGQLSEVLGKRTLEVDKKFRTLRFRKAMVELMEKRKREGKRNKKMWGHLTAFYEGVNEYIKKNPLPIEFHLLGYEPKPFGPYDAFSFSGYMGYSFATSFRKDVLFSTLASTLSKDMFENLRPEPEFEKKKVAAVSEVSLKKILGIHEELKQGFYAFEGSNAWVLSGKRSKSGKPILASDPHVAFATPGVWFEAHIKTPNHEIYGHYLPLIPFPALGHNKHIAWGLTMSKVDDMDFYKEKMSSDGKKVKFRGEWQPIREYEEVIQVKGEAPKKLKVRITPHGPLLDQIMDGKPISVKWSFYHPKNLALEGIYRGARAKNWTEFTKAFGYGAAPGLNIAYADSNGDIGSMVYGRIPNRPKGMNSDRVLDGASGRDEYSYFPTSENPRTYNPESGVIVLANWRPLHGKNIAGFWSPSDRFDIINSLLKTQEKWSVEELKEIQTSSLSQTAQSILPILLSSLNGKGFTQKEKSIIKELTGWNYRSLIKSKAALIYHQWNLENKKLLFDELPVEHMEAYCSLGSHWFSYKRLLQQDNASWWDLKSTDDKVEKRNEILFLGFQNAIKSLSRSFGSNIEKWTWGKAHTVEHVHPLGKVKPLNYIFNLGPYGASGGYELINNLASKGCANGFKVVSGPSTRRLIDFKTPGFSWGVLPLGNSGHILSEHYRDQKDLYLTNKYRFQLMNSSAIEKNKVSELILVGKKRKSLN